VFVAILGILKAGGAYVAVDTRYPDERRDTMVAGSGARIVVTGPRGADRFPGLDGLVLDPSADRPTNGPALPALTAGTAACVLFTSGSSGRPKAIVLEHRNLVHFATNTGLPGLRPGDRVGHASSLSFDAFHWETWCGFAAGAQLVVLPTIRELVETDVQRELRRQRVTAMLVPTMAVNQVVHEDRDAFSSLRVLCTGGDVVLPSACRTLLDGRFEGEFVNLYGPTEGTTACTAYDIRKLPDTADTVPIGRALAGTTVHVLDDDLDEVPDGEPGELYLGGAGVARGYLGQPGLTADRFRPDPYAPGGGRMYATADRARRRPDGVLEFIGRADDQVKIRGYRVEPREVERLLGRHPGIRDVAVLAAGDAANRHLVGVVVPYDQLSPKEIRQYAAERMPEFMVPSVLVRVEDIPVNDHGKRDLDSLRAVAAEQARRGEQRVDPRDDVEQYLAELWEELLTVEQVGVGDDFFALGGNSMIAFRVQQRVKRELEVPLAPKEILVHSRLDALAGIIRERKAVKSA
jgi:amino acid adenylation domain-containing protein